MIWSYVPGGLSCPPMTGVPEYLTVAQIAERWACSRTVVYDEIRAGRLRALTIGKQGKRISAAELGRYERERSGTAG